VGRSLKNIFNESYSALCNYAYSLIEDRHAAEDIVQSIFISLWENDKLLGLEHPESYLLKCVKFKCIDHVRSRKIKKEVSMETLPDIGNTFPQSINEEDILPLLNYFVSQLPNRAKEIFLMSRQQGMTYREIAEELDLSVKTIENHMGSALKKLRILLQKHHYLPVLMALLN